MTALLFPIIGCSRIWTEEFIREKIDQLPCLNWKPLGKFVTSNVEVIPNCSGVYCFVRKSIIDSISPFSNPSYPAIVYVGQGSNLRVRLMDYIKDKSAINRHAISTRKIRDSIRVMYEEYGDDLDVFCAICNPKDLSVVEDTLIKIFDPVFNTGQKLNEDDFVRYEKVIGASLGQAVEAYSAQDEKDDDFGKTVDMSYGLGRPEPAF